MKHGSSALSVLLTTTNHPQSNLPWLFSPTVDLLTFLGSAALALGLLAIGQPLGWLEDDSPEWLWIVAILMIDVAHVYATGFRVYFDRNELSQRPWLYALTPLLGFLIGWAIYSESPTFFWRALAYLAVFHFVRQQHGWISLYRARGNEHGRFGKWVDSLAIYLATLYPLIYWHSHLPRRFWWFLPGDFAQLPTDVEQFVAPIYWLALLTYFARSLWRGIVRRKFNPGKDIVMATTATCWYVGIVTFNSDYAFTVTNVIIHGIPYMVLVYWYRWGGRKRDQQPRATRIAAFVGMLWLLAYVEELLWDCGIWHDRSWLFGPEWNIGKLDVLLVPLLAVPQITHYILDGFIWRRKSNAKFASLIT